ncbi:hypothetical protein [Halalkalicoccus jeotgali]|nr:hypothetical protein [Halalkalicoccus jeotgali]
MTYTDYAETGTKCALCGKKMFVTDHEIDGVTVCSEWCVEEYRRREGDSE